MSRAIYWCPDCNVVGEFKGCNYEDVCNTEVLCDECGTVLEWTPPVVYDEEGP